VLESGWTVLNFDALTYAANLALLDEAASYPNYSFVRGDICDRERVDSVLRQFAPDAIMHLAAESHVDRSIAVPADFIRTNIVGAHTLLEAALGYWEGLKDADAKARFRFLHVSTDEVFGSLGATGQFIETTSYDPRSPYSASKAASDHLASAWRHTYGLPVLISRCSNTYGPGQFPEKLIPVMILKALVGAPLPVYGDGRHVRDWLYVDDHAAALECILTRGRIGESYNVGGGNERTNLDVVQAILDLVDELAPERGAPRSEIAFVEDRPGHDRRYAMDCAKIETELGWRATVSFDTGLRRTVQWYLDHREAWAPIGDAGVGRQGLRVVT
jgi:dTDP-glucose 4,6-dehydratase